MGSIENQFLERQEEEEPEAFTGTFRTCFNGINTLLGVGILAVPYALSQGGWLSLSFLFLLAISSWYTGLLIQRCMNVMPASTIRTYPDIGQKAFGHKGRLMISILLFMDLYLVAVEFLILGGDSLERLFPNTKQLTVGSLTLQGHKAFILITALVVLPTTWLRSLGLLAYVSAGGILASVIVVGCVLWAGAFDGLGFHRQGVLFKLGGLPTTISLFMFLFGGHAVFPTLCNSMKNRNKFSTVLYICFFVSTICYGSMAILGYLIFGSHLDSQITLSLPRRNISTKVAICTTLVTSLCKYAVITSPIFSAVEEKFHVCKRRPISILVRTLVVLSTFCVALFVPFFGYIMSFIGALPGVSLSLLLPCVCYLKINPNARKFGFELIINIGILLMGSFIMITGTYTSLKQIISHL